MAIASILILSVAIDLLLGDPPTAWHPTGWMGRFIALGQRAAPKRGVFRQVTYGALLILIGGMIFAFPAYWGLTQLRAWNEMAFVLAAAVILKMTFTLRGLMRAAQEVQSALDAGDLAESRRLVAWHLVSRDTHDLDQAHVISATIESVAENLADSLVAPLFYFALFGVPGALFYRFVNTADSMIGYHGATEYLGKFAARFDDVLNFIPSRIAGLLVVFGASLTRADAHSAGRLMLRDHGHTASPNAGWPMSAMAGALNVQLEKMGHYQLGDAARPLEPGMISQSGHVMLFGALAWMLGLCAFSLFWS